MIDLKLATTTWDQCERNALDRVIDSGQFTMGDEVALFEIEFSQMLGCQYSVMVNSGSSANLLAVASLFFRSNSALSPGDEVVVPAVSWSTSFYPLQQYGLKLKFVDIDRDTLNYDLQQLEKAICESTRGILCVNLLGNPNDYRRIEEMLGGRKDVYIIEDNCESLGAELDSRATGTFGILSTHSTFFSHHISTMEGGLICTDDEELYQILLSLRSHGWTRSLPDPNLLVSKNQESFYESFRFVLPGYNVRPIEMSGALGREQIKKLPSILEGRRANAKAFVESFNDHPFVSIQHQVGSSSWFGFAMILSEDSPLDRDWLVKKLESTGVECRPIVAGNFTRNEVIRFFDYEAFGGLANADWVHDFGFFVGNHHYDIRDKIENLRSEIDTWFGL